MVSTQKLQKGTIYMCETIGMNLVIHTRLLKIADYMTMTMTILKT